MAEPLAVDPTGRRSGRPNGRPRFRSLRRRSRVDADSVVAAIETMQASNRWSVTNCPA